MSDAGQYDDESAALLSDDRVVKALHAVGVTFELLDRTGPKTANQAAEYCIREVCIKIPDRDFNALHLTADADFCQYPSPGVYRGLEYVNGDWIVPWEFLFTDLPSECESTVLLELASSVCVCPAFKGWVEFETEDDGVNWVVSKHTVYI
jgi:hypothetical protein